MYNAYAVAGILRTGCDRSFYEVVFTAGLVVGSPGEIVSRANYEFASRQPAVSGSDRFSARCPLDCYFGAAESDFHSDWCPCISIGVSRSGESSRAAAWKNLECTGCSSRNDEQTDARDSLFDFTIGRNYSRILARSFSRFFFFL